MTDHADEIAELRKRAEMWQEAARQYSMNVDFWKGKHDTLTIVYEEVLRRLNETERRK